MTPILYTTHCPQCSVLENALKEKHIEYQIVDNVKEMLRLGIHSAPCLSIAEGEIMTFPNAYQWVLNGGNA